MIKKEAELKQQWKNASNLDSLIHIKYMNKYL